MKTIVINLDRDQSRWVHVRAQLDELGASYERLSAIDARTMAQNELRGALNRFRWWCAIGRPVRPGEIGCAMSHFKAWEKCESAVCVLEDDVVLDPRFLVVLKGVETAIDPTRPQVVLLSNHNESSGIGNEIEGFRSVDGCPFELRRVRQDTFAEGYVITRPAAAAIRRANWPLVTPGDLWGRWARRGLIELYHAFPTVCSQDKSDYASETIGDAQRLVKNYPLPKLIAHKVMRCVGVALDKVFCGLEHCRKIEML